MQKSKQQSDLLFVFKKWEQQLFKQELKSGSITMMPCPPGHHQLKHFSQFLKSKNIDLVVSLLQPQETHSLGLEFEETELNEVGIEFINFPIKDHSVPGFLVPFQSLIHALHQALQRGKNLAIHCYAGIGRTGLVSASLMVKNGHRVDSALLELSRVRGLRVPETLEQISWLHRHEDQL